MKSVDMLKAGLVRHGEDDEESISCPHVLLPHSTELLLTSCVQHCENGWTWKHCWTSFFYFLISKKCPCDLLTLIITLVHWLTLSSSNYHHSFFYHKHGPPYVMCIHSHAIWFSSFLFFHMILLIKKTSTIIRYQISNKLMKTPTQAVSLLNVLTYFNSTCLQVHVRMFVSY